MYEVLNDYIGDEKGLTYKKLCDVTGLKYYKGGGTSKTAQIKDIERYYNMKKEGTKYKILEKYEEPHEKIDLRAKGNNSKYGDDIETILLYNLQREESDVYECTIGQALLLCNMVNGNYSTGRKNIPLTSKILELDEKIVYGFYDSTNRKLKDAFERALNKMRGKALISYEKRTKVVYKEAMIKENEYGMPMIDENDTLVYRIEDVHRYATEEERKLILESESFALDFLGFTSKQEVFLSHMWNDYIKILNGRLLKLSNIKYYYEVYNIVINHKQVDKIISSMENKKAMETLNLKVVSSLEHSANRVNENIIFRDSKTQRKIDKQIADIEKMIYTTIDENCEMSLKQCIEVYNQSDKKVNTKNSPN